MTKIVIANSNPIHKNIESKIKDKYDIVVISDKESLTFDYLSGIQPKYDFFPHWSFIIPKKIYDNFECIVFHMTDLPYGRGGSPLQNLIVKGHQTTKISAIRVGKGIDTGPVYLKRKFSLLGNAEEIFLRLGTILLDMIVEIIETEPPAISQTGDVVIFKRRKPEDGNMIALNTIEEIHNYIRMLDAEGYPKAFIETDHFKFEFSRASLKKDSILADVRIIKK